MKLAADSTASWSFVAQTLQRADTTKVKDTKEDIDTLLVFVRDIQSLLAYTL